MLITICYSVISWIQARQRSEILLWVEEVVKGGGSLVLLRDLPSVSAFPGPERPASSAAFFSPDDAQSSYSFESTSRGSSAFSTPRHGAPTTPTETPLKRGPYSSLPCLDSSLQTSALPYNQHLIRHRRLLWQEEGGVRVLALYPKQLIELHEWTGLKGEAEGPPLPFRVLLEASPGEVRVRSEFRGFSGLGRVGAWKWACGGLKGDLALILDCSLGQLIQLMHLFRHGLLVLEGGWRVYRITTVGTEGLTGTLLAVSSSSSSHFPVNPGELRRLSALGSSPALPAPSYQNQVYRPIPSTHHLPPIPSTGIFERISNLSNHTSRHDITTINEETASISGDSSDGFLGKEKHQRLQNWAERSPRKRSLASAEPAQQLKQGSTPRRRSFCPGFLLSSKSSSLASLHHLQHNNKASLEEEEEEGEVLGFIPSSKSHESLSTLHSSSLHTLTSPLKDAANTSKSAMSLGGRKTGGGGRTGKPPNILVLCQDEELRGRIGQILRSLLSTERYAIYDIRWDQLGVGGWAEATALLVLAGKVDQEKSSLLLQFLGDGGRLLAWAADAAPFGVLDSTNGGEGVRRVVLEFPPQKVGGGSIGTAEPLPVSSPSFPAAFERIVETTDSEGISRPLTASVWARVKGGGGDPVVLLWDGGALGGKAVLSLLRFDLASEDEGSLGVLSHLLGHHLGIDCTQIKQPEYSKAFLLGDHMKVEEFLSSVPEVLEQPELTLEFVGRGEKGSIPSHARLPIHILQCPANFSTLDYYDNLETKELGRLVIYADTMTSTSSVLKGKPLRHGLTVIAKRQTSGKGRGRNVWLSPEGCALFSVQLRVDLSSPIGRRLSLLQHLAALSLVLAVPERRELQLRVKWPNDIYAGAQKIGGVLVDSRLEGSEATVNVGIGFNVSNPHPTTCLNSLLFPGLGEEEWGKRGKGWRTEKLIALALSRMEALLDSLEEEEGGLDSFLSLYQEHWLHGVEELVEVEVERGAFATCRIVGVDEFGFLRVAEVRTGNEFSVRPDGNSFDIANKLIAIKE